MEKPEAINHPQHYGGDTTYEAIKVIRAWGLGFSLGNAVKYICRAGKKIEGDVDPIGNRYVQMRARLQDLKKAAWYVNEEMRHLEQEMAAGSRAAESTGENKI